MLKNELDKMTLCIVIEHEIELKKMNKSYCSEEFSGSKIFRIGNFRIEET